MKLPLKTTVLLAATLCAAGAVQAQTKIKIADSFPVGHYLPKYVTTPMMERLKALPAAKGIEFEYYPAEQMGKAKDPFITSRLFWYEREAEIMLTISSTVLTLL